MEKYSVDRIEDGFAVLESNGKTLQVSLDKLPKNVKEGCILAINENKAYFIDEAETEKKREVLNKLQNSLFDE